jgi:hypothetical protein
MSKNPIQGKTVRWTFDDGPMKKKTFEHTFDAKGRVTFRMVGEDGGKATTVDRCEIEMLGDDVCAVSYLGPSGYTLTTVLDMRTGKLAAFASNDKTLTVQHGRFQIAEQTDARPDAQ